MWLTSSNRLVGALAALLCVAGVAKADTLPLLGVGSGLGYTGPGNIVSGATAWFSCARAYNAVYAAPGTNKACNLRNTSTNETCDELLTMAGAPGLTANCTSSSNGHTLAVFCNPGCAVTEMYDQTGNGWHILQATAVNQPALTLSCVGTLPCVVYTTGAMTLAAASNLTPASGIVSLQTVSNRTAGTTSGAQLIEENGANNSIHTSSSASQWQLSGPSVGFNFNAANSAWHAVEGVINGASSAVNVDATRATGTATGVTTAGKPGTTGLASTTIESVEMGIWDNLALSSAQATALCKNVQAAYGGGNFGAAC